MRLWHYKLIPVLPNQMLVSQWRECIAIKRQWEKGTLKHRLVSYVMEHSREMFYLYTHKVAQELKKRNIKYQSKYLDEIMDFGLKSISITGIWPPANYPEHNDRYLDQCYFNLQEKHDRGIISDEEWKPIEELWTYSQWPDEDI